MKQALVALNSVPLPEKVKLEVVPSADQPMLFSVQLVVYTLTVKEFLETATRIDEVVAKLKMWGLIDDVLPDLTRSKPVLEHTRNGKEGLSTWIITMKRQ
jgi:hypothetical protein